MQTFRVNLSIKEKSDTTRVRGHFVTLIERSLHQITCMGTSSPVRYLNDSCRSRQKYKDLYGIHTDRLHKSKALRASLAIYHLISNAPSWNNC